MLSRLTIFVLAQVHAAEFSFPPWFSHGARSLIERILDPNPRTRITVMQIREDDWFKKNYVPVRLYEDEDANLDDVQAVFDDTEEKYVKEQKEFIETGPSMMNAFNLIALSQGLNLAVLFDRRQDHVKRQTRFISRSEAKEILARIDAAARLMNFKVHTRNFKMRLEELTPGRTGQLSVAIEVFEVAPAFYMVEVRKAFGDILEYHKFYKDLCCHLRGIIWKSADKADDLENAQLMKAEII
ncbi:hypothetical protein O6H91_10G043500 [Diphasiastrum complanatum]|uniref:Uncharacterized protein n=1 Tax=Diphasiastrum complanatum TaxID=34168 RepID=A0ACC2CGC1_DIPCM|nr:hypothetical protein O6H91_10G043500 [Diphasiastrum complanatum]